MKIKGILFSFLIVVSLNLAYAVPAMNNEPGSIERYTWVGGNKEGTVVAFMLSYFGPSSGAPFVRLFVKEMGKVEPVFTDGASMFSGGEKELAELASNLLKKNAEYLKSLDITLSNDFIFEANMVIPWNNNPMISSGWVDIQDVGLRSIEVKAEKSGEPCFYETNSNSFSLEYWFDGVKKITVPSNDNCGMGSVIIRNVFKTKQALWFIVYRQAYGLGAVDTWWIDVEGIKY